MALFTHPEAVLVLPGIALAVLLVRGPRFVLKWDILLEAVLVGLGLVGVYLMNVWGQQGLLEVMSAERPFIQAGSLDPAGIGALLAFFIEPYRLPWTVASLAGLAVGLWAAVRGRLEDDQRSQAEPCRLALYSIMGVAIFLLVFMVGSGWQAPRYVFMVLPFLFLTAGQVLAGAGRFLRTRIRALGRTPGWAMGALVVVVLTSFTFLAGREQAFAQELGYDQTFRHVRARWREGDVIMTISPAASALYLGRCDYFAIQRGYEVYLMERDGALIDRWAGATPLTEVSQLVRVLRESPRAWFVVDGWRLQSRYDLDFVAEVVDHMELEFGNDGAFAFLAQGYPDRPDPEIEVNVDFGGEMRLLSYGLPSGATLPGEPLDVALDWQATAPRDNYIAFVYLVGQDGERIAQSDSHLLDGFFNPALWEPGEGAVDVHMLPVPADAPSGLYRVEMGLYRPGSMERLRVLGPEGAPRGDSVILDYVQVGKAQPEKLPQAPVGARLGEKIELLGYDAGSGAVGASDDALSLQPGEPLDLTLHWRAASTPGADYTVFVHLVDEEGRIAAQWDGQPLGGFAPTSSWRPGRAFADPVLLPLEGVPAGRYELYAGMYLAETGERLRTQGGKDRVKVAEVQIGAPD